MVESSPPDVPDDDFVPEVVTRLVVWEDGEPIHFRTYDFKRCATRVKGVPQLSDVLAAIAYTMGNRAEMAHLLGIPRATVAKFVRENSTANELMRELTESILDHVEATTFRQAMLKGGAEARFVLNALARDRGYGERVEHSGVIEMPPSADFSKMSTKALKELKEAMSNADDEG